MFAPCLPAYGAQSGNAARTHRGQLGEGCRWFGLQPHDAAAEAAHLAERGVERGGGGADPFDLGDRLGVDGIAEREQHRDVRGHLASEVAQVAGTQVVQRRRGRSVRAVRGRCAAARSYHRLLSSSGVEFVVARNPDSESSLPFLDPPAARLRRRSSSRSATCGREPRSCTAIVPKGGRTHPRSSSASLSKSCARRGAAIDLVLDRGRENRSQFVFTKARGREVIFWQSARTAKQARPNVVAADGSCARRTCWRSSSTPTSGTPGTSATNRRRPRGGRCRPATTPSIDDDGEIVAAVERKSLADLVVDGDERQVALRHGRSRCAAARRGRRRGPLLGDLQADSCPAARSSPMASPSCRCATRPCRSCSARPASSPRSGPTGSSARRSSITDSTSVAPCSSKSSALAGSRQLGDPP